MHVYWKTIRIGSMEVARGCDQELIHMAAVGWMLVWVSHLGAVQIQQNSVEKNLPYIRVYTCD